MQLLDGYCLLRRAAQPYKNLRLHYFLSRNSGSPLGVAASTTKETLDIAHEVAETGKSSAPNASDDTAAVCRSW